MKRKGKQEPRLELEYAAPSWFKLHPGNPRIHPDEATKRLVLSLQEFGWTAPVLISADDTVLAGHNRIKAAQLAGVKEIPYIRLPLIGDRADAYMITDNRITDLSYFDNSLLKNLLESIDTGNLNIEITGFSNEDIELLMTQVHVPESEPEFDESVEKTVKMTKCPECGHEFPA